MILTPTDIARFLYCPMLPKKAEGLVYKKSTLLESCIGKAIKLAEHRCLLNESDISSRKISKAWDDVWWPTSAAHKIDFKDAGKYTMDAMPYFLDYCKYDLSDFLHPVVSVDVETKIPIGQSILHAHIDMIKVDLTVKHKNMMLVDFSKKNMKTSDVGLDPGIAATALALSRGEGETIQYVTVQIDESKDKLFVTSSVFRPSDMERIRKVVSYVEHSIRKGAVYGHRWKCEECKACPSFKYLMKEDSLLRQ